MATELNILMKQFNGSDYDTLYPKTKAENVENVYNKQEVLSDATKTLFELPLEAVPDNAFNQLYQYLFGTEIQEYRWFRTKTEWVVNVEENASIGESPSGGSMQYAKVVGSTSYYIDSEGKFSLGPAKSADLSYPWSPSTTAFANNYIVWSVSDYEYVPYPKTSGLSELYLGGPSLTIELTRPDNELYYLEINGRVSKLTSQKKITNEIVTSTNPNAYPDSGTQDGWTYTKLPPILNKVGLISVGNYQGTGKNGVNNKNSITLQYPPKALVVMQENGTGLNSGAGMLWVGQNQMNTNTFAVSGNTISWYASAVGAQMNTSGVTYHYLAIC